MKNASVKLEVKFACGSFGLNLISFISPLMFSLNFHFSLRVVNRLHQTAAVSVGKITQTEFLFLTVNKINDVHCKMCTNISTHY